MENSEPEEEDDEEGRDRRIGNALKLLLTSKSNLQNNNVTCFWRHISYYLPGISLGNEVRGQKGFHLFTSYQTTK